MRGTSMDPESLRDLAVGGAIIVLLVVLSLLAGCGIARPPLPAVPSIVVPESASPDAPPAERRESAEERVAALKGQLEQAQEEVAQAKVAEREARFEAVHRVVTWACSIAALVGIIGTGLAIGLRSKSLLMIPIASAGMVAAGLSTNVILDHPVITVGGLGLIVAALVALPAVRERLLVRARKAIDQLPKPA